MTTSHDAYNVVLIKNGNFQYCKWEPIHVHLYAAPFKHEILSMEKKKGNYKFTGLIQLKSWFENEIYGFVFADFTRINSTEIENMEMKYFTRDYFENLYSENYKYKAFENFLKID